VVLSGVIMPALAAEKPAIASLAPSTATSTANPAKTTDPLRSLLDQGWQEIYFANWPKAQSLFEQAEAKASDPDLKAEALLGQANVWQLRRPDTDVARAKTLYERVSREFAGSRSAPWALLAIARLADLPELETDRDVALARQRYEEILASYPGHYVADEAALRLASLDIEKVADVASENRGAEFLETYLAARPQNPLAAPMHLLAAEVYSRHKDFAKAVEHWIAADKAWLPLTERGQIYYRIAYAAEHHLKDYALAAVWYAKITTDAGRDARYYVGKIGAERCRRLAAEAASVAKGAEP